MAKLTTKAFWKIIPVDIYHQSVLVIMGYDKDKACSIIETCGGGTYAIDSIRDTKPYAGLTIRDGESGLFVLYMPKMPKTNKDVGNVHHELFHVVTLIMDKIGMKLKILVSDEAYAYLLGYLSEEVVFYLL